jgi:hypothetical protein
MRRAGVYLELMAGGALVLSGYEAARRESRPQLRTMNKPLTVPLKLQRRANGIFQSFR